MLRRRRRRSSVPSGRLVAVGAPGVRRRLESSTSLGLSGHRRYSLPPTSAAARRSRAICCTAPRPLNDGLDSIVDLDARYTSGQVTRNTTTTSRMVVRPRVNAKPLHLTDGQEVEHRGGEEADRVARQDRLAGPRPASWHRRPEGSALADLVLDAFEEHDERVGGRADTDDQTGDTGQVEGVADVPAEQHQDPVDHGAGGDQRQRRQQAEHAVVQQRVEQHQRRVRSHRRSARPAATSIPVSPRRFRPRTTRTTAAASRT